MLNTLVQSRLSNQAPVCTRPELLSNTQRCRRRQSSADALKSLWPRYSMASLEQQNQAISGALLGISSRKWPDHATGINTMCSRTTTESDIRRKVLPEYLHAAPLAILNRLCQVDARQSSEETMAVARLGFVFFHCTKLRTVLRALPLSNWILRDRNTTKTAPRRAEEMSSRFNPYSRPSFRPLPPPVILPVGSKLPESRVLCAYSSACPGAASGLVCGRISPEEIE